MSEPETLPPGWAWASPWDAERDLGPYELTAHVLHNWLDAVVSYAASATVETADGVFATKDADANSLPDACRRAEELARELAEWRPPPLPRAE